MQTKEQTNKQKNSGFSPTQISMRTIDASYYQSINQNLFV